MSMESSLEVHLQLGFSTTLKFADYSATGYDATDYCATNYTLFRACEACLGLCCSWPPQDAELLGKA